MADSRYHIDVTQEDIDKAITANSARCVVAQAIARTFPHAGRISVDIHSIRFTDGPKRYTYLTPPAVEQYIVAFDAGDTIHPFSFRLRTDQRLVATRTRKTPAGKRLDNADQKVRHATRAAEKVAANPDATPAVKQIAYEKVSAAEANKRVVQAEVAAQPRTQIEKHPDLPPEQVKPRAKRQTVHGRNARSYGHRLMRINQPDREPGDFRGPLDTE